MASRLEKIANNFRVVKGSWDSIFLRGLEDKYMAGEEVLKEPYTKHDLVYICISTTQRAVSQVPIIIQERKITEGEAGPEEIWEPVLPEHPLQKLFSESPNPLMDPYTFIEALVGRYMLDGNVFVIPFPPGKKMPDALYVVALDYMKPIRDKASGQLGGWMYVPQGEKGPSIVLPAEQVLHFALWNPMDQILGMAPLNAVRLKIKTDYKASIYNERFFDNGAVPHGVLSMAGKLSEERYKRMKEQVEHTHRGYNKAHRLMVLEEGLQYTQMGLSQRDMDFGELSRLSREAILQCFGMKKSIISVIEDVNRATAEAERKEWWQGTIVPMLRRFAFGFTHKLVMPYAGSQAMEAKFDTSGVEALQENFGEKVNIANILSNMGFTPNEINQRLELGFDKKSWRDKWWAPMSLVPVGEGDEERGGGEEVVPPSPKELPKKPEEEELPEEESFEATDLKAAELPLWERRSEAIWKTVAASGAPLMAEFENKVSRFFLEMRKRALRYIKTDQDVHGLEMETFDVERARLAKWIQPLFFRAVRVGLVSVKDEIGDHTSPRSAEGMEKLRRPRFRELIDPDVLMVDTEVVEYLRTKVSQISGVDGLTRTIRRQIQEQLALGAAEGESFAVLAERLRSKFNVAAGRARMIAKTEVFGAMNMGRDRSMKTTSFKRKIWYTAGDERVRETHAAMNGETVGMYDVWMLPGGSYLRYPGDAESGAPASEIINCRCIVTIDPDSL